MQTARSLFAAAAAALLLSTTAMVAAAASRGPSLAINDVSLAEGNAGTTAFNFTVSLTGAPKGTVTVGFATVDGTATAGSDYAATSGTLVFSKTAKSRTVTVLVIGDTVSEGNETFTVRLSGAVGATIADGSGLGTILDDDAAPTPSPSPTPSPTPIATPTPTPAPLPNPGHVFVILMENEESTSIIGNASAPYINSLASQYGLATNYTAVAHPSEPNYFALWSGSTQGVTDDGVYNFGSGTTLADQIEASGRSWHVAAQNVPLGCYTGATASGGEDGTGTYARKHEPAISWTSVSGNPTRCVLITDFTHFDPNAGSFWFIVPNLCNDMHDCSIATGDAFLQGFMPTILNSPAFADSVVYLTWDEGSTTTGGGGKVATIVISPYGKPAFTSSTSHSHYSLLHTIQSSWSMPCLANTCSANDLREFFR